MQKADRYPNLDGMRGYAAIGVALMHIAANGIYNLSGVVYDSLIPSFSNFIYMFMMFSAFSLCCGYYKKFAEKDIDLEKFYKRRYQRIWPYFAILCTLDLIASHNLNSLYEWFADLTLAYGLLPNANLGVVGVGWFLGVIFVFYMIFPFFVFLIGNKKRAWAVLAITVIFNYLCRIYFLDTNHVVKDFRTGSAFLYSAMFFIAGGLIYLYREKLKQIPFAKKVVVLVAMLSLVAVDYFAYKSITIRLVIFSLMLILLISADGKLMTVIFQNRIAKFLGSISMEIYLCHMFIFRILQKVHVDAVTKNDYIDYWIVSVLTLIGAIITAVVIKKVIALISGIIEKKRSS